MPYILTYGPSHLRAPPVVDWRGALPATEAFWRDWSAKSTYAGRWRQPMQRSLLTLKALTYATTGGIIAAPPRHCLNSSEDSATATIVIAGCMAARW